MNTPNIVEHILMIPTTANNRYYYFVSIVASLDSHFAVMNIIILYIIIAINSKKFP